MGQHGVNHHLRHLGFVGAAVPANRFAPFAIAGALPAAPVAPALLPMKTFKKDWFAVLVDAPNPVGPIFAGGGHGANAGRDALLVETRDFLREVWPGGDTQKLVGVCLAHMTTLDLEPYLHAMPPSLGLGAGPLPVPAGGRSLVFGYVEVDRATTVEHKEAEPWHAPPAGAPVGAGARAFQHRRAHSTRRSTHKQVARRM